MSEREASVSPDRRAHRWGRALSGLCIGLSTVAWLGCGGGALDSVRLSQVGAALRAAEEMGANDLPKAALHLDLARDEMTRAQRLAEDGEEEDAALLLARAQADAELALQLTKTDQEQQKARSAWQKTQELEPFPAPPAPPPEQPPAPAPRQTPRASEGYE